jgi:hypothetical protein
MFERRAKCLALNCPRESKSLGYCKTHYKKILKHGKILHDNPLPPLKLCMVSECQHDFDLNGYCHLHFSRIKKHSSHKKPIKSLAKMFPIVAEKIIVGDPYSLPSSSWFKATWKCSCNNIFIKSVQSVVREFKKSSTVVCRECRPKKQKKQRRKSLTKSFFTQYPDLIKHSICKLDFTKIACTSPLPVLWKCTVCENPYWLSINDMQRRARTGSYLVCNCCTAGGSFRRDDLGWLYLVARPGQLKVGITNTVNGTGNRMKRHRKNGWMQLDMIGPMNGEAAHQLELRIKHELDAKNIPRGDQAFMGRFDGYTEAWQTVDLDVSTLRELFEYLGIDEGKYHGTRQATNKERSDCDVADSTERIAGGGAQVLDPSMQSHPSIVGHGSRSRRRRGAHHGSAPARPRRGDATGSSQRTFHYA